MLDLKTMRAIGGLLAQQARARAREADAGVNEVIDLGPLLEEWKAGTAEMAVTYAAGDVRTYAGQPWKCVQGHTHHGEPGWEPGTAASLWTACHATDAAHALPWVQPTGAHDMYQAGEYMIWTDKVITGACRQRPIHPRSMPRLGKNIKEQMMENLEKSAQENGLSSKSPQAQMMLIMQGRRLHLKESIIYVLLLLAILAHILQ